ncbi:hypothetical protein C5Y97_21345 [Blastopirellula marina]|uniref:Uncharacterized protein n=1 Tax=Blastopirellula marina TaxID=124 RepID=A0A2S8FD53_9BACT|nr:hypothetical protein C5Y98_21335 [Blastopirellula marina]PQO43157.1 hypothetical protein C5Y93_25980 [Blastopirellula marina]PTL42536.1 hypothetical protein C5Y97_21345 [Blastopirellula marina]
MRRVQSTLIQKKNERSGPVDAVRPSVEKSWRSPVHSAIKKSECGPVLSSAAKTRLTEPWHPWFQLFETQRSGPMKRKRGQVSFSPLAVCAEKESTCEKET